MDTDISFDKYLEVRDDISLILCEMGDIADLNSRTKEYDSLHDTLCEKLILLDRIFKGNFIQNKKPLFVNTSRGIDSVSNFGS